MMKVNDPTPLIPHPYSPLPLERWKGRMLGLRPADRTRPEVSGGVSRILGPRLFAWKGTGSELR